VIVNHEFVDKDSALLHAANGITTHLLEALQARLQCNSVAGDGSPSSCGYDEKTAPQGTRKVSAHTSQGPPSPSEKQHSKRLMLLIEYKVKDAHLNKAVRHLRLESNKYDVLVRPFT
jgi:hypothetical protein